MNKEEIIKLLIETAQITYRKKMKTATETDMARDKELYFLMKTIPQDATWKEAYAEFGRRPRQKGEW